MRHMGLFYNYNKPGKGVEKDAPKKKGIFLYFELFFRKFFKICTSSMLYFLFSIPNLIITFFMVAYIFGGVFSKLIPDPTGLMSITALTVILFVVLWGTGPASAAYAYILRSFAREEHTWIWSDFIKIYKENLKQSLVVMVLDYAVMFISTTAIFFYANLYMTESNVMWLVLAYFCFMIFLIYTFVHFYVYNLMVTFKCTIKELFRNSFMLAIGKSPMNLILAIFIGFVILLMFSTFRIGFSLFLLFIGFFGFLRFPIEFYVTRVVQKLTVTVKEDNNGEV